LIIFILALCIPSFISVGKAGDTAVVWTDKKDYRPDETAYIYGYGFTPYSEVNVTVVRPDSNVSSIFVSADQFGYFVCGYVLDGVHGVFNVTATDGIHEAETSFSNCLFLRAYWRSHCCWYIWAKACFLWPWKSYYVKYFDPAGIEQGQSQTYSGVWWFKDNFTILPSLPNILGQWSVKLYQNGVYVHGRTRYVTINRMVWTTNSTYNGLVKSFFQGSTMYYKAIGLNSDKYYRMVLETPSKTRFNITSWTTGVTSLTGSYVFSSTAETGSWKLHVREANDASGTCEHHYVDTCYFEVTSAPPPPEYYLTVQTDPAGIVTIPGEGWYNVSTYVNLTAPDVVSGSSGIRYTFSYWDVDGISQGMGTNSIQVFMDSNHTATAHYVTQYYLNVTSNPSGVTTPAGSGWYDANTNASIFTPEFVGITPDQSRYRFDGWTTTDMDEIADPSATSTTVLVDKPKTVTANYVVQYNITFAQSGVESDFTGTVVTIDGVDYNVASLPVSFWWDSGSTHDFAFHSPLLVSSGLKRYLWTSTAGLSNQQSDTITVAGSGSVTGNYKTQYLITFQQTGLDDSAVDTVLTVNGVPKNFSDLPLSMWVDNGSTITYCYSSLISSSVSGKRFALIDVSGPPSPVTVTDALTFTGNYKVQYLLTLCTNGLGTHVTNVYNGTDVLGTASDATPYTEWFDQGSQIQLNIDSPIVDGSQRFVFNYWSGDASGSTRPLSITLDSAKDITANYKTQFLVTFGQTGLDDTANSVVVTIDGASKGFADLPFNMWVDEGDTITYAYSDTVTSTVSGKRFSLINVTGPVSPITVTASINITGNYKVQYEVTFDQSGVGSDYTGMVVTVDGDNYTVGDLSVSFWWDEGSTHNFAFHSPLVVTPNAKQYLWVSTSGLSTLQSGSLTVSTSGSVTGNYKTQYYLTVTSAYDSPTPASGWFDNGTSITASVTSPWAGPAGVQYVCTGWTGTGSVPASGTTASVSFTINEPSSVTWNWKTQYYLDVQTNPAGLSPAPTPSSGWYDEGVEVTLTAPDTSYLNSDEYSFDYWEVDGNSPGTGVNPITVIMDQPHTAIAYYTFVAPPSPLSVTISPLYATIYLGDSVVFTSTVSGGTSPYSYQWYLDDNPVSGATSSSWTFTPSASGIYYVYLKVTDANNNTVQSGTARVTVSSVPVGGYSISIAKKIPIMPMAAYTLLLVFFGVLLSLTKHKRK